MVDLFFIAVPVVAVVMLIVFILLPRYGPHYKSRLTCPDCKKQFTFHWIPGGSFIAMRSGKLRRLKCPYCHHQAIYNIVAARIRKNNPQNKPPNHF
jgi:DNA-directed RNA polymerase subunit RPC12/RpoP